MIIKTDSQGRTTRIRDIGRAELGSADYGSLAYADRYPGAPFVVPTPNANVVELEHAIWKKMAEFKKTFPPGVDYIRIYDPTTFVSQSIHEVSTTVLIAVLLVVLVEVCLPSELESDDGAFRPTPLGVPLLDPVDDDIAGDLGRFAQILDDRLLQTIYLFRAEVSPAQVQRKRRDHDQDRPLGRRRDRATPRPLLFSQADA